MAPAAWDDLDDLEAAGGGRRRAEDKRRMLCAALARRRVSLYPNRLKVYPPFFLERRFG
jgi:hypothetical protein